MIPCCVARYSPCRCKQDVRRTGKPGPAAPCARSSIRDRPSLLLGPSGRPRSSTPTQRSGLRTSVASRCQETHCLGPWRISRRRRCSTFELTSRARATSPSDTLLACSERELFSQVSEIIAGRHGGGPGNVPQTCTVTRAGCCKDCIQSGPLIHHCRAMCLLTSVDRRQPR